MGADAARGGSPTRAAAAPDSAAQAAFAGTRSAETIARERDAARAAFHRAVRQDTAAGADPGGHGRRHAAARAFFAANAGRSLLPTGESSGAIAPQLKTEEP